MPLTKEQMIRQDFVDHSIFELLQDLTPTVSELEWDFEAITEIRDAIQDFLVRKQHVCTQEAFYPV